MDLLYSHGARLDVHKKTVVAHVRITDERGRLTRHTRTFGTMTADLLALAAALTSLEVTHVAMESTGEYWKPVYNLLEGSFTVLIVNAHHIKNVPGRKTDVQDAQWLADLLCHGLVRGSFIPPQPQRDLRDLTRQRTNLVRDRATVVNRLQKVLEWAQHQTGGGGDGCGGRLGARDAGRARGWAERCDGTGGDGARADARQAGRTGTRAPRACA
jgi:transposase